MRLILPLSIMKTPLRFSFLHHISAQTSFLFIIFLNLSCKNFQSLMTVLLFRFTFLYLIVSFLLWFRTAEHFLTLYQVSPHRNFINDFCFRNSQIQYMYFVLIRKVLYIQKHKLILPFFFPYFVFFFSTLVIFVKMKYMYFVFASFLFPGEYKAVST